jgi:hypothetical protein
LLFLNLSGKAAKFNAEGFPKRRLPMRKNIGKLVLPLIVSALALTLLSALAMADGNRDELPVKEVGKLQQYISETNPYTGWQLWPGTHKMYPGKRPHGEFLTTYVNDIALQSLHKGEAKFPLGSIIVKENYTADKKLDAVTVMYKVDGYNPMGGDWYWLRYNPAGIVEAQGQVTACIGCHSAMITKDWVFTQKP